jgi:phage shock protein E
MIKQFLFFSLLIFSLSCVNGQTKNINPKEFNTQIAQKGKKIILDVRTDAEVAQGIIEGAQQIDFNKGDFEAKIVNLDKNTPIYLYCAAGGRSGKAAKIMEQKGFKNVTNLSGGINAWKSDGLKLVTKK